jgi:hypothetical protein
MSSTEFHCVSLPVGQNIERTDNQGPALMGLLHERPTVGHSPAYVTGLVNQQLLLQNE